MDDAVPVSVVISTLNRPQQLASCLDALLSGTRRPTEIVVVDQGDASATAAVLDARRDRGVALRHILQTRRGLSASQNVGVRQASCPVVAITDDDCVPDARWIETAAREHASATPLLVTGRILPLPEVGDRTVPLSSRSSDIRRLLRPETLPWDIGSGGNFSVTRSAYLEVGGNDERLGTGTPGRAGNDVDLFHRLAKAGVHVLYEPGLLVRHARTTVAEYRSRRWSYGFGLGACVAVWLAEGEWRAVRILAAWVAMRIRRSASARPYARSVVNEMLVLLGTVRGLAHGSRIGPRPAVTGGSR